MKFRIEITCDSESAEHDEAIERVRDAAPDLLEALKALLTDLEECGQLDAYDEVKGVGIGGAVEMALAAIDKAEKAEGSK